MHVPSSNRVRFVGAGLIAGALLLAPSAQAALTHYVPFDAGYTVGGSLNDAGGSDLGFSPSTWFDGAAAGTGTEVVAGNLTAPAGLPVAGNSARTALSDFNLAFYSMDIDGNGSKGEPGIDNLQPGEHWLSFVGRATEGADFGGFSFVKFFGPEILYIGKVGGSGSNEWGLDQGAGGISAVAGSDATQDTFVVAKLTIGPGANDDTVDLFLNPALGATPPATPDIAGYGFNEDPGDNRAIDEIRLGSQNGAFHIDEIRIGSTFADVALPEPSVAALLTVGVLFVGSSRRRRRQRA